MPNIKQVYRRQEPTPNGSQTVRVFRDLDLAAANRRRTSDPRLPIAGKGIPEFVKQDYVYVMEIGQLDNIAREMSAGADSNRVNLVSENDQLLVAGLGDEAVAFLAKTCTKSVDYQLHGRANPRCAIKTAELS
jgi:hypothetical protein